MTQEKFFFIKDKEITIKNEKIYIKRITVNE